MGLILGPLFIFWLLMGIYSLKIGYSLLGTLSLFPSAVIVCFIAIFSLILYVYLGFESFKANKELWWCDIPLFFTANKMSFFIFIVAILVHWFGSDYLTYDYIKPVPFIIMFTISLGAITGSLSSDAFMDKYKIERTY